ncbi:Fanconi anemia core complex-associated protein 20 [Sceloporus undulatus]|uniref:Fanconi anemia core complex-associated protein 20 n=1 Tax=Sceloporus undulatus TaxID=8520 RepID=UPI001C4AAB05|nr:Fanconi anemia core complex-associated protein 20 [Sceloporus undulatus]
MLMRGAAGEADFQGNGARGGKLSLRRKRPLVLEGEREGQPAGEGPLRSCASIASQFQRQGDGEGAWMTLLRALEPHPDPSSLEEIANLPVFLPKRSQTANPEAEPEAFNAGTKAFQWFPFPVYQRQSRRENGRGNPSSDDTLLQGGSSLNESASTLPSRDPCLASFSGQEKTEHPTLEKCPLCQMRFPGTWSGLEVDSHLSQCLSESTDDVVW